MKHTWHNDVFFGLHFDIHALNEDPALGRDCDRAELVRQFRKVKPDFVQCDCKGHPGLASYPTKVGIPAPHIVKDALREWRAATKELNIPLIMHYNRAKHLCVEVGTRTQPVGNDFMAVRNISADMEKPLLGSRDAGTYRILTSFAAATIKNYGKGKIAGIYGPIYREYYKNHYHLLRKFLEQLVEELEPRGLVHAKASPNLNLSVRTKDNKLQVHMVNLSCDPITPPKVPALRPCPQWVLSPWRFPSVPVPGLFISCLVPRQSAGPTKTPASRLKFPVSAFTTH